MYVYVASHLNSSGSARILILQGRPQIIKEFRVHPCAGAAAGAAATAAAASAAAAVATTVKTVVKTNVAAQQQ